MESSAADRSMLSERQGRNDPVEATTEPRGVLSSTHDNDLSRPPAHHPSDDTTSKNEVTKKLLDPESTGTARNGADHADNPSATATESTPLEEKGGRPGDNDNDGDDDAASRRSDNGPATRSMVTSVLVPGKQDAGRTAGSSSSSSSSSGGQHLRLRQQPNLLFDASSTFSEASWEFTIASSSINSSSRTPSSSRATPYRNQANPPPPLSGPRQPLSHLHAEQYTFHGLGGGGGDADRSSRFARTSHSRRDEGGGGRSSTDDDLSATVGRGPRLDVTSLGGKMYGRDAQQRRLKEAWDDTRGSNNPSSPVKDDHGGVDNNKDRSDDVIDNCNNKDRGRRGSFAGKIQHRTHLVRTLVTIQGASGTGKSTLAESIRSAVTLDGGFFLHGKFPQPMSGDAARMLSSHGTTEEPYVAFAMACHDLCDLVSALDEVSVQSDGEYDSYGDDEDESRRSSWSWSHHRIGTSSRATRRGENPARHLRFSRSQFVERLGKEVGADSRILTRVIPRLAQILSTTGSTPASTSAPGTGEMGSDSKPPTTIEFPTHAHPDNSESIGFREGHLQFKFAFRRFVRAVTSFGPVCIVLDDLQWADAASMELLEALMSDRENGSLLVVGSYRDDKMYESLPHLRTIENLSDTTKEDVHLRVVPILVDNLDVADLQQLVTDLLEPKDAGDATELAECVHKKTHGNIFFVLHFLSALYQARLLTYSSNTSSWKWDVAAIRASAEVTENVVSLMKAKMLNLPDETRRVLPIMACLGSSFSFTLFQIVDKCFQSLSSQTQEKGKHTSDDHESLIDSTPLNQLAKCESEGLIEVSGIDENGVKSYRWVHDKIQEAAFTLISDAEMVTLKLMIGKALFVNLEGPSLEKNLFVVASLLSSPTVDHPTSLPRTNPIDVANLFLRAGVRSIENSAFEQASAYLLKGIDLLPPTRWQEHSELSRELFSAAAEAEFCTGHFDRMRELCNEVIKQKQIPLIEKRRVYNVLIDSTGAEERLVDALGLCREILAKLGCRFPNRAVKVHVVAGILKIKSALKKTTTPELLARLPAMHDETKMWMMDLINKFGTYAYLTKSDLLPLAIFKGLRLTMSDGVSYISPCMFALVGLSLAAFVGDYKGGLAFADQALELLKQVKGARKVESRVVFLTQAFVMHWLRPLSSTVNPLLASYDTGMTIGDTESAAWSIYMHLENSFRIGVPLEAIAEDCAYYAAQLKEVKQVKIRSILLNLWQAVLHLTGENPFYDSLSGEIVQQATALREAKKDFEHLFAGIYRMQLYVAFALGSHNVVYSSICETGADRGYFEKMFPGIAGLYHLKAFNAFSMIALYRETGDKKYLKLAKQFASSIKALARAGNPNVPHFDALLDAELASISSDRYSTEQLYEVAVLYASRLGYVQDHALAHELYGEFLACRGSTQNVHEARIHLVEAMKLYEAWGARAKVDQMQKKHYKLMQPSRELSLSIPTRG